MSDEPDGGADAERLAALRAENDQLRDALADRELEVLALRDRLIGAEAELSSYAGIPELYQQTVGSTTWRIMWRVMTPYRKVRERMGAR